VAVNQEQCRARGVVRRPGRLGRVIPGIVATLVLWLPAAAQASLFQGETLDMVADYISWVVLVLVPVVGIAVFWLVHILPEKVAEQKRHPQAKAIQVLCLLSLFFGGLLWPIAWLWAYTKPVMHKLAYGTDVDDSHGPPPGVGEEPEGTLPVLTTEAEVPAATRAARQGA
jgi:hypothetical protein